ncbi:siroheme synthase CysG [Ponticaulis sp.]|uniref:siroheme synthase CysG n=1 Tax=Ponticaulis sp. TaxID=2020902 RepID=UPI000B6C4ED7|nr:siroheme synthase CysG [Ponticaulis sp.]MAI90761.1 uroporphyrinogen-III C-methyltransferase [Ponticaulis sp.]OUX98987.1 MAG: uroporphyrinogen-III C-methyltransferase [Hyphomonadaceae bacterium TMED5]
MELFPVFFGSRKLNVAVFGGGETARRKVRLLAKTHARIFVISDAFDPALEDEFSGRVEFTASDQSSVALDVSKFAIIAEDDKAKLQAYLAEVRAARLPVNVVDRPDLCDFTVPSILDRGSVVAGIATGGAAPVLARNIRARLEALMPERMGELADFARSFRGAVKAKFSEEKDRKAFWEKMLSGPVAEKVLNGHADEARADFETALNTSDTGKTGVVHIVGAGPGDPELLTLKALRLLQEADIVFYDNLVGAGVLDLIRRDADRVSVGKSKGYHSVPQEDIHELLITAAKAGRRVVRLKGGDPFIFGRGGEELQALQAEGIEAHVVPGISSALGCAASAGLPLTHRDHAQSVTFVTGHARKGGVPDLDWASLASATQTVVVYMGVGTSEQISDHLITAGRAGDTPVAVIENGTRENEIRAYGRLRDLGQIIQDKGIKGPALLIIGDVAALPEDAKLQLQAQLEMLS